MRYVTCVMYFAMHFSIMPCTTLICERVARCEAAEVTCDGEWEITSSQEIVLVLRAVAGNDMMPPPAARPAPLVSPLEVRA